MWERFRVVILEAAPVGDWASIHYTSCNAMDGKKLQYLDRQHVKCENGDAIATFKVTRHGCSGNDMRYKYTCAKAQLGDLSTEQTFCNKMDSKKLQYLDRQDVKCGDGKLLAGFKVVRSGCSGKDMRYEFQCGTPARLLEPQPPRQTSCNSMDHKKNQ